MTMGDIEPSSTELDSISDACNKLWELDDNRLEPGEEYHMNLQLQALSVHIRLVDCVFEHHFFTYTVLAADNVDHVTEGKRIFNKEDMAEEKLFTGVSQSVWQKRTYLIFYHLLDNYERSTGVQEETTDREHKEQWDFLRACMQTRPMQYCFRYLVAKGLCDDDEDAFVKMVHQAWFSYYRRDEQNDSCGFEHVFVGEIDDGHVKGLHNWIQTMVEEARGDLDYLGFVLPRRHNQYETDEDDLDGPRRVVSIQLGWEGEIKDVSTMFVGTSPEFELALYTLCFLAGEEVNRVTLGEYDLDIKCYRINSKYGDKVSTCFPVALE